MTILEIPATYKTPYILLDLNKGKFEIKGRSIPENSKDFYKPIIDILIKYHSINNIKSFTVIFDLEYFNSSSAKLFSDFFKLLKSFTETKTQILWYYSDDDEDSKEIGEDFKYTFKNYSYIDFEIKIKPDNLNSIL